MEIRNELAAPSPINTLPGSLSIFFPCYNDAGTIGTLVVEADSVAKELTGDYEILVIDDGSRDHSRFILSELAKKYDKLRLIFHETNRGYGGALQSGFNNAKKDWLFYTDGDGQYDVDELRNLVSAVRDNVDVINGYKIQRNDPIHRIIIGSLYVVFMRMLFQFRIKDVDCDFRLMRTRVFREIELKHNSGVICLELVKKLERRGFRFAEVPVHHYHRIHGKSQFFNFKRLLSTGVNIFKLWHELYLHPHTKGKA